MDDLRAKILEVVNGTGEMRPDEVRSAMNLPESKTGEVRDTLLWLLRDGYLDLTVERKVKIGVRLNR